MSEFNNLKLEVADEIAVLTISRPAALNALNSETLDELNVALTEIEARDDVRFLFLQAVLIRRITHTSHLLLVQTSLRWLTSQQLRLVHLV